MIRRVLVCLLTVFIANSVVSDTVSAQAISQGYKKSGDVQPGMVVRLAPDDPSAVTTATIDTATDAFGVAVSAVDAPATISNETTEIYVTTSGSFKVLVSDENGDIAPGDYLAVSTVQGVAMQSDDTQAMVVAIAREAYSASDAVSSLSIKTADGADRTVRIGRIVADIQIKRNPDRKVSESVPGFLQSAGRAIAGKDISARRIYIAAALLLATSIITGMIIYGAIRSSIVSLGRNPLGKSTIIRSLLQVLLVGLLIFSIGLIGVYLILRL